MRIFINVFLAVLAIVLSFLVGVIAARGQSQTPIYLPPQAPTPLALATATETEVAP